MRKFTATKAFWKSYHALSAAQRESVQAAWKKFQANPADPSLRVHKINNLSSRLGRIVRSAEIEGDLRVIFCVNGDEIETLDVGSHKIYR